MPDDEKQVQAPQAAVDTVKCEDAKALLMELSPLADRWRGSCRKLRPVDWRFRGHGDAEWHLVPSALREGAEIPGVAAPQPSTDVRLNQIDHEAAALREFVVQADATGLSVPGVSDIIQTIQRQKEQLWDFGFRAAQGEAGAFWPPDHLLDAFALAQHYGVPTRLLDWTEAPLVAAYFVAIDTCRLRKRAEKERTRPPERCAVWALNRPFFLRLLEWPQERGRFVLVRSPRSQIPNLHAQGGVFTVDRSPGPPGVPRFSPPPLEKAILDAVEGADQATRGNIQPYLPGLIKLTLRSEHAGRLLKLLFDHRVNGATVFPGYAGTAMALAERAFYDHSDPDPTLDKPEVQRE